MRFLFGDGAGAVVLQRAAKPGFITGLLQADGSYWPRMAIFSGATLEPATIESVRAGRTFCQAPGRYPPEMNIEFWPAVVRELARRGSFQVQDIDLLVLTQVRKPTIEEVMKRLELPMDKTYMIMEEQGYTGSACIPMAFNAAVQAGHAPPGSGQLVVMVGSGVGWNLAGCAFRMA
jgi:3-oxoacyl-[acyl-carrier-protein] synthase-3